MLARGSKWPVVQKGLRREWCYQHNQLSQETKDGPQYLTRGGTDQVRCRRSFESGDDRANLPRVELHLAGGACWGLSSRCKAFSLQVLHGNTACDHVPHLVGRHFTGLKLTSRRGSFAAAPFELLLTAVCDTLQACRDQSARWCGHRVWILDGSSCSMPDTRPLQAAFGQPGQQAIGCGFPVAHLLTLFHAGTGLLQQVLVTPLRTHDLAGVQPLHAELAAGDVVLGDRGFCSICHLALLVQAGLHGVFRLHQKMLVDFRIGRMHSPPWVRTKT